MSVALETANLRVGYKSRRQDRVLLVDASFRLNAGEIACLAAPNGAGKSTLIRTLCGLHKPLAGAVRCMGADVFRLPDLQRARLLSTVLTGRTEPGELSVYQVVALGRYPYLGGRRALAEDDLAIIESVMRRTNCLSLAAKNFATLSDGERQRVMIARALAQEPKVLLLDEPVAHLDPARRVYTLALLRNLAREHSMAVLLSTHEVELAIRFADRLYLIDSERNLSSGIPEMLVLNGSVKRVLSSSDVQFNEETAEFQEASIAVAPTVEVRGDEPLILHWTKHFLRRINYTRPVPEIIFVWRENNEPRWSSSLHNRIYYSLTELTQDFGRPAF